MVPCMPHLWTHTGWIQVGWSQGGGTVGYLTQDTWELQVCSKPLPGLNNPLTVPASSASEGEAQLRAGPKQITFLQDTPSGGGHILPDVLWPVVPLISLALTLPTHRFPCRKVERKPSPLCYSTFILRYKSCQPPFIHNTRAHHTRG